MTPIRFEDLAAAVLREIGDGPPDGRAPRLPNPGRPAAAISINRFGTVRLVPILTFDFYPKEPA